MTKGDAGVLEAGWTAEGEEAPPYKLITDQGVQPLSSASLAKFTQARLKARCRVCVPAAPTSTTCCLQAAQLDAESLSCAAHLLQGCWLRFNCLSNEQFCMQSEAMHSLQPGGSHGCVDRLCNRLRMQSALARLMGHEEAWPFLEPVSAADVPDYHTIIKAGSLLRLSLLRHELANCCIACETATSLSAALTRRTCCHVLKAASTD